MKDLELSKITEYLTSKGKDAWLDLSQEKKDEISNFFVKNYKSNKLDEVFASINKTVGKGDIKLFIGSFEKTKEATYKREY